MRWPAQVSEDDVELVITGSPPEHDGDLVRIAELLDSARYVLLETPSDVLEERHLQKVATLFAGVTQAGEPDGRRPTRSQRTAASSRSFFERARGLVVKTTGAVAAASLSLVGLAYAGVDLPGTVTERTLKSLLGIDLPNQGMTRPSLTPETPPIDATHDEGRFVRDPRNVGIDPREDTARDEVTSGEADEFDWSEDGATFGKTIADDAAGNWYSPGDSDGDDDDANPTGYGQQTGQDASRKGQRNNPTGHGRDDRDAGGGRRGNRTADEWRP